MYKSHMRELILSLTTSIHITLELLTEYYFRNKGFVMPHRELYNLLNAISILSLQMYRRGEWEVLSWAVEFIAVKISKVMTLRQIICQARSNVCSMCHKMYT